MTVNIWNTTTATTSKAGRTTGRKRRKPAAHDRLHGSSGTETSPGQALTGTGKCTSCTQGGHHIAPHFVVLVPTVLVEDNDHIQALIH